MNTWGHFFAWKVDGKDRNAYIEAAEEFKDRAGLK